MPTVIQDVMFGPLNLGWPANKALAGVLVMDPQLLLLDKPTTSLDPPGQHALLALLKNLPQTRSLRRTTFISQQPLVTGRCFWTAAA